MKHWADPTIEEKLDRLAQLVHRNCLQIKPEPHEGYELLEIGLTQEGWDECLGVYPGIRDKKA
jgi:hypothetical protein